MVSVHEARARAAQAAALEIRSGQVVGLGTGRTAALVLESLAAQLQTGRVSDIQGIPTSESTRILACRLGIRLASEHRVPDLTIDGADEITQGLGLVKGAGGALLREKVIAQASARFIVVVDWQKRVERLGSTRPVPLEIVPGLEAWVRRRVEALGAVVTRRDVESRPFWTDNRMVILDAWFEGGLEDPERTAAQLIEIPGLVEHGLFLKEADEAIVGTEAGGLERFER